jgi:hypothetical protein
MAQRRLPVIQEPTGEDAEAAARPHWHWVLIGAGFWVTAWTPLAWLLFRKIPGLGVMTGALVWAASFALAAFGAGYLVARFGPRTRIRHAALAGATASAGIWLMAAAAGGFATALLAVSSLLALSSVNTGFAALGAWLQRRKTHG